MEIEYKHKYRFNPRSNRLENYDYTNNGGYFITICTKDRQHYFGEIVDGTMMLTQYGKMVEKYYLDIPKHFPFVLIDSYVIMPDHLHFVFFMDKSFSIEGDAMNGHLYSHDKCSQSGGITGDKNCMAQNGLGKIINWYKSRCTFEVNKLGQEPYFPWQGNYYDRIIRNQDELDKIRKYIKNNPIKWQIDKNNEKGIFM